MFSVGEEELPEESEVVEEAFEGEMKRHRRGEREQDKRTRTASDEMGLFVY